MAWVLLSAALHATWNALLKRCDDKAAAAVLLSAVSLPVAVACAPLLGGLSLPAAGLPWVAASAAIEAVYFGGLAAALHRLPLGSAYGLSRGMGLLVLWPLAVVAFDEPIDAADSLGAGILALGLFSLVRGAGSWAGIGFAAATGLAIAAYPATYKGALAAGVTPCALFGASIGASLGAQVLALGGAGMRGASGPQGAGRHRAPGQPGAIPRLRAAWARDRRFILPAGVLCAISFVVFLAVLRHEGPGRITALRNASIVFAAGISALGGEGRSRQDLLAAGLVTVGCVLVAG